MKIRAIDNSLIRRSIRLSARNKKRRLKILHNQKVTIGQKRFINICVKVR